jgi:pyruvyltransferase
MKSLPFQLRKIRKIVRVRDRVTKLAHEHDAPVVGHLIRRAVGLPEQPILMYWFTGIRNFGDILSPVIVEHMSNGIPVHVTRRYRGKLVATGSVLYALAEGDRVWGAGAIRNRRITPPPNVVFHAVRGPLTRALLQADVPETYGDPATLLPTIYRPKVEKRFELGLVPHYKDMAAVHVADPSIAMINVQSEWREVVKRIVSCQAILSSSLHGLIVAEAYGIPAVWIAASDNVVGEGFKFRDYYLATGREPPEPLGWNNALKAGPRHLTTPPHLDVDPILRAWPKDLTFPPEPRERSGGDPSMRSRSSK